MHCEMTETVGIKHAMCLFVANSHGQSGCTALRMHMPQSDSQAKHCQLCLRCLCPSAAYIHLAHPRCSHLG